MPSAGGAEPVGDTQQINRYLLKKVDELELSVRSANCLKNDNIIYIGDHLGRRAGEGAQARDPDPSDAAPPAQAAGFLFACLLPGAFRHARADQAARLCRDENAG